VPPGRPRTRGDNERMAAAPRPPLLVALRVGATILMSLAIAQAGFASAFLTGSPGLRVVHGINAYLIAVVTVGLLVLAVLYQRSGGPRWVLLAVGIIAVVEIFQIVLGRLGVAGTHIFLGVLFVVMATLLTSYLFRPGFIPVSR
jgi:hypothetical protein